MSLRGESNQGRIFSPQSRTVHIPTRLSGAGHFEYASANVLTVGSEPKSASDYTSMILTLGEMNVEGQWRLLLAVHGKKQWLMTSLSALRHSRVRAVRQRMLRYDDTPRELTRDKVKWMVLFLAPS